jgi:hypothetical protein
VSGLSALQRCRARPLHARRLQADAVMNETPVLNQQQAGASVKLVQEVDLSAAGDPLTGAAFVNGHLVVASGGYLLRLAHHNGRIVDRLETRPDPGGLAFDGRYLWQHSEGSLQQLDPRTGFVRQSVSLDLEDIAGLECLDHDLLVLHDAGRRLARLRPCDETNPRMHDVAPPIVARAVVIGDVQTGALLRGLTWARRCLWSSADGALVQVDPFTGNISARVALPAGVATCDVAVEGEDRLWCLDATGSKLRAFAWSGLHEGWSRAYRDAERAAGTPPSEPSPEAAPAATALVAEATATFERVLVPVDFSEGSRRALAAALLLKDLLHSEVHLLHLGTLGSNAEFLAGSGAYVGFGDIQEDAKAEAIRFVENVFPGRASEVVVHAAIGEDVAGAIEAIARQVRPSLVILADGEPHARWPRQHWRRHVERAIARLDRVATMVLA